MSRSMKDSGVAYIGEIGSEFDVKPINSLFAIKKDIIGHEPDMVLSITQNGIKPKDIESNEGQIAASYANYQSVNVGDFAMNHMDLITGGVDISKYEGVTSPDYRVFVLKEKDMVDKFFLYVFQLYYKTRTFFGFGQGVANLGRWRLPANNFKNILVPITTPKRQKQIADALDKKCSEIDELIANQQKQIEKLKQYKQSLITEVVTKGLNSDVEMKESGYNWIGFIPLSWNVARIKNSSSLKGRIGWQGLKTSDYQDEGPYLITGTDFNSGVINWNTCVHISEERFAEDENIHIKENDLLITKDGTIGKVAVAKECPEKVSLNSGVLLVRNEKSIKYFDRYMYYMILSNVFWDWYNASQTGNSTIKHLYQGQFENFAYPLPTMTEQEKIAEYLDEKCGKIDSLIAIKQQKIEKLNQYKKSIIYEYVTGKKEE